MGCSTAEVVAKNKKVSKKSSILPQNIEAAFSGVMSGAQYTEANSKFCAPNSTIRKTSYSGILRFVSIFTGQDSSNLGLAAGSIACGTGTALVVELLDGNLQIVSSYFRGKGLLESSFLSILSTAVKWYGTVDG